MRFEGERIPVLGRVELALLKAAHGRLQAWAGSEAMLAAGTRYWDSRQRCQALP